MSCYDDYDDYDDYQSDACFISCKYCTSSVLEENYENHLEKVHKCRHCANYTIKCHIEQNHMEKCPKIEHLKLLLFLRNNYM